MNCGGSSEVEHLPSKQVVTGSIPVPRSNSVVAQLAEAADLKSAQCGFKSRPRNQIGRSSNGRTTDFDSVNLGSIPSLPAKKEIKQ